MLRYHMIVVTRDAGLRRAIKRLTTAAGATADFSDGEAIEPSRPADLAVFDSRAGAPDRALLARVPGEARILYIVPPDDLAGRVSLFEDARVTSLFGHDQRFDDDEFISSATKALRGEIFGLQKYFPWGVTTFTMLVKSYAEKTRAIDLMMRYAELAGVRAPVRDRIQLVADELMTNALYHAPTDADGREKHRELTLKQLAQLPEVAPIQVQYGCSGRYFGVAVRDSGGSLPRERVLDYLRRAQSRAPMEDKQSGAGLGLVSVLNSVSKLVFNLAPSSSTEVIGLFDMELFGRGAIGARSLHLFTASAAPPTETEEQQVEERRSPEEQSPQVRPRSRAGGWLAAALIGAAATGLGTAYVIRYGGLPVLATGDGSGEAAAAPRVAVYTEPEAADITVGGEPVGAGVAVPMPRSGDVEIRVVHPGYRPWSRTLSAGDLAADQRFYVRLDRDE